LLPGYGFRRPSSWCNEIKLVIERFLTDRIKKNIGIDGANNVDE